VSSAFAPNHGEVLAMLSNTRRYNEWLYARGRRYVRGRILDVGAGVGTFVELALRDADHVTALEPDSAFAAQLRVRFSADQVDVCEIELAQLEAPVDGFDAAICFNVLEHVVDDRGALERLHASLAKGARLLLLVPAHAWLVSPFDRAVGHERRYERAELRTALESSRFDIEELRYVNPVGAVGWLVSMRIRRRRALPTTQVQMFDRLVPFFQPFDRLRLPFGQSLWAVARRR
jgi:SAM-dependent methyltransferase